MKTPILLVVMVLATGLSLFAHEPFDEPRSPQKKHLRPESRLKDIFQGNLILRPEEQKYLLDSTISYPWEKADSNWASVHSSRSVYEYSGQGKVTAGRTYQWNSASGTWTGVNETLYAYDAEGNVTALVYNNFSEVLQQWIPDWRDTLVYSGNILIDEKQWYFNPLNATWFLAGAFLYDEAGSPLEDIYYSWDENFVIIDGTKTIYTLNTRHKPVETLWQILDTISDSWINESKTDMFYAGDTMVTRAEDHTWQASTAEWNLTGQALYIYEGNLLTDVNMQIWDGTWENSGWLSYEYDEQNRKTRDLFLTWGWVYYDSLWQYIYRYNASGLLTERLYQSYGSGTWNNLSQYLFVFNEQNIRTELTYRRWSSFTGLLTSSSYRNQYAIDENNLNNETIYQKWDPASLTWANNTKSLNYYSLHEVFGLEPGRNEKISVFPNPATTTLFISGLSGSVTCSVYDLSGSLVLSRKGTSGRFDISELSTGLYIAEFTAGNATVRKKFVKR